MTVPYKARKKIATTAQFCLLLLLIMFSFFPIFLIILNAFKSPLDLWLYPPKLFTKLSTSNFIRLSRESPRFFTGLKNSLIITFGALIVTLLASFPAAFAFSRYKSKFLNLSAQFLIIMRMFPPIVITIPLYPFLRSLGLLDKHITIILINTVFSLSLATFMMKTFIDDIPIELEEAAMIEGCSKWKAFVKITLPLTAPGITAIAIFVAIGIWNEYTFSYIFSSARAVTAPVVITTIRSDVMGVNWGALFASCVIHLLPMLIMVIIIHKHLIKGMQTGAIK
jgi:multiple sugar transport system permease protein